MCDKTLNNFPYCDEEVTLFPHILILFCPSSNILVIILSKNGKCGKKETKSPPVLAHLLVKTNKPKNWCVKLHII